MRRSLALVCLFGCSCVLLAQSGVRGAYSGDGNRSVVSGGGSAQAQSGQGQHRPGWGGRRWVGGGWWGGGYWGNDASARPTAEEKAAPKEDKLKELIISPVYEPAKVNPKMIEIP